MDDIYIYVIGGAVILIVLIVLNHRKQKNKVNDFLRGSGGAQPVFMQAAVEKKLKTLKVALYGNTTGIQLQAAALEGNMDGIDAKKQFFINQLDQLEKSYASGNLPLEDYDNKLHQMIMKISQ